MPRSIRRLLIGIDQVPAVIDDARTAGVDQCPHSSFIAGADDVSRSFHIYAKEQILVSFSHRWNWRRSRVDDHSWLYLLEDVEQSSRVSYIAGMVGVFQGGGWGNVEEVDFAFGMSLSKQRNHVPSEEAIRAHKQH